MRDMHLRILLILPGLTGIHSKINTVGKVSVQAGGSISIPCLYDSQYMNNVKYLCKGYYWSSCSYAVRTNQQNSGKFSISDDNSQRVFTVTIKDLMDQDTDYYWCSVEIDKGSDDGQQFHLSVNTGTPSLYVNHQQITGFNGQKITINCNYSNSGEIKWCRLGSSCVTDQSGSMDGTRVTISKSVPNVFTVTMSELRTESSGWYYCVKGDFQMPVHVTVAEQPTSTTLAMTRCFTSLSPTPEAVNLTTVFADNAPPTVQSEQHSASKILIIPLSLLFFMVMVILFIWFMLKKHKQNKSASSAMTAAEEDVLCCNTGYTSSQRTYAKSDVDMVYITVVTSRPKSVRRVEANDENVTYSTLACSTSTV